MTETTTVNIYSRLDHKKIVFSAEVDAAIPLIGRIKAAVLIAVRQKAHLSRANLSGADLSGADLSDANLSDANLSRADLSGANLSNANLSDADLSGADLSGANLSDAHLSGANLSDANLSDANLSDADLSGANLSDADLVDGGQRSDGYRFVGWIKHGVLMIRAGCRNKSLADYRTHNAARENAALRDETTAILDHIETVARIRSFVAVKTAA